MQKWIITPIESPKVLRNCPKCGVVRKFACSNNFRVNANGRNIDVWLIYKCEDCDSTWNMTVLSRVKPEQIEKSLYTAFAKNNADTARKYAFDKSLLSHNHAVTDCSELRYTLEKQVIEDENNTIEMTCEYDFGLRLDRAVSEGLGISRTHAKSLLEQNNFSPKTRVYGTITLKEPIFNEIGNQAHENYSSEEQTTSDQDVTEISAERISGR
ncbi:MAG TPA: DUF1062 domain-containing protein [Oscillospiraceae bacterium]|nr:DUF1062 domain-containing protein [Oscillospiraceae bacterium]HPF55711.1 DUF1062 domain-containing protein [Clostridiales bacterium]HPK35544.1 DUF1062 domain-containing protein [Oscillospiraceae bacterium]HPR75906.1 DUF1062 domain-containing protein [Oscillospiraceae bacterium]